MKSLPLFLALILASLSGSSVAHDSAAIVKAPSKSDAGADPLFAQSKERFLERLDMRLSILQRSRQCMSSAKAMKDAKVCLEQEHGAIAKMMGISPSQEPQARKHSLERPRDQVNARK